jgi:hypothetical protein
MTYDPKRTGLNELALLALEVMCLDPEEKVTELHTNFGIHGVEWGEDEVGKYVRIGMALPAPLYAEIEDGTYGEMQAVRYYYPG